MLLWFDEGPEYCHRWCCWGYECNLGIWQGQYGTQLLKRGICEATGRNFWPLQWRLSSHWEGWINGVNEKYKHYPEPAVYKLQHSCTRKTHKHDWIVYYSHVWVSWGLSIPQQWLLEEAIKSDEPLRECSEFPRLISLSDRYDPQGSQEARAGQPYANPEITLKYGLGPGRGWWSNIS